VTDTLFVDTWGWVALQNPRDHHHDRVKAVVKEYYLRERPLVTSNFVLDETITLLYSRQEPEAASRSVKKILSLASSGFLDIETITTTRFRKTLDLRWKYSDKPGISFTDLSSMAVMEERGIKDVITGDAHFEHVGMGFRRRP
jgi:predicted nucleic acid-binding protein